MTHRRGPWLEPCFLNKGYDKLDLVPRTADMKALIDKLNIMQLGIAGSPGYQHVRHVELRGALKVPNYTTIWDNELHPRYNGFLTIAERFDRELRKL